MQFDIIITRMIKTVATAMFFPLCVLLVIRVLLELIKRSQRIRLLDHQSSMGSIRALHWQQFELLISEAFRRQGYQVVERGGPQADGGVDLILQRNGFRYFVQCKHWKTQRVGPSVVRELYGVMAGARVPYGIVVTSGRFTEAAKAFAQGKCLELIDGHKLLQMVQGVQSVSTRYIHQLQQEQTSNQSPACPTCGACMEVKLAKRGAHTGSRFWGCSRYPQCHGKRQISMEDGAGNDTTGRYGHLKKNDW